MGAERHVKLSRNGDSQVISIPREFELPGEDAVICKQDGRLIIEPAMRGSLFDLPATLSPIDEDFPPIADQAP